VKAPRMIERIFGNRNAAWIMCVCAIAAILAILYLWGPLRTSGLGERLHPTPVADSSVASQFDQAI
jgi:hypothetical protein